MSSAQAQPHFKHFNKYDFVKSFTSQISDPKAKEEEERKAVIIADAIEETQVVLFEHLATKQDLVSLEHRLEQKLVIKLTAIMAALLTFLPLVTEFFKRVLS